MNVEKLTEVLMDLAKGEISEQEALKHIKDATPAEISRAEQNLLQKGVSESELQKFCKVHLKAVEDEVEHVKESLSDGHPIKTLMLEHEEILKSLEVLEDIAERIKEGISEEDKERLKEAAYHLIEAEKHHKREEDTLFPRLKDKGITGPPRIMEMDHEDLWPRKKKLDKLVKSPEKNADEIKENIDYIVFHLRDHIFKENNILYPSALNELEDWDVIKKECDSIGYCCFTPRNED
ncbi:MAG: DUF438 domain-containing protein [Thermoplasmatota archaeon]